MQKSYTMNILFAFIVSVCKVILKEGWAFIGAHRLK